MKKIAMLLVAMVATLTSFAQVAPGKFTIEPMVGFNVTDVTGDYYTSKVGVVAGVDFGYQFTKRFGLSVGALYSLQGAQFSKTYNYEGVTFKVDGSNNNLSYINVPVLANVYVWRGLAVKAGVQPGFMVGATGSTDPYNTVDLSIPVGVSYDFGFGLTVDGRYNIGVTNIVKYADPSVRNSVFQITAGYKFKL